MFLPPLSFKISLRDTSFHISLDSLGFLISPEWLLNFLWLAYSNMCGENVSIYGIHIPRKCIESMHFYSCPSPLLKTRGRSFWKSFSPERKGWGKLWFALSKFNQKIWRWLETLVYLHWWLYSFVNNIYQIV